MRYFQIQLQRVLSGKAINAAVSTLIVVMPILFAITNTNFWNNYSGIEPETKQNMDHIPYLGNGNSSCTIFSV